MKFPPKKRVINYMIDAIAERFIGFIVGMWASGLVSLFFETRNLKNLWGLRSHKTLITKSSYEELEWWVAAIVGFIAYEIVNQFLKDKIGRYIPHYRFGEKDPDRQHKDISQKDPNIN
jgi:hypothetical protein